MDPLSPFPSFNANVTPVFVHSVKLCNAPDAIAYKLHASGQNLTYSIIEGKSLENFKVSIKNSVVMYYRYEDIMQDVMQDVVRKEVEVL